jgi:hypothetical protein
LPALPGRNLLFLLHSPCRAGDHSYLPDYSTWPTLSFSLSALPALPGRDLLFLLHSPCRAGNHSYLPDYSTWPTLSFSLSALPALPLRNLLSPSLPALPYLFGPAFTRTICYKREKNSPQIFSLLMNTTWRRRQVIFLQSIPLTKEEELLPVCSSANEDLQHTLIIWHIHPSVDEITCLCNQQDHNQG